MKIRIIYALLFSFIFIGSCNYQKSIDKVIEESLSFAMDQYSEMTYIMKANPGLLPRSFSVEGKLIMSDSRWWASGFYPGALWYLYEYSNEIRFKEDAVLMSDRVEKEQFTSDNHDVGFIISCSFGNGLRLTDEERYKKVLITGARSLSTRFRPNIGCIQSWESIDNWQCPVIIDNMMNLELLMIAFKLTGDSSFYEIAVTHADTTIKNHFRTDFSTYHIVSYDTISGIVEAKVTAHGANDESAWARGQSWGLYGYTMMYRETKLDRYLKQAQRIADFLITHPNMPADKVPYWDYNAPDIPDTEKDASAAAIMASALIELSGYSGQDISGKYLRVAEEQLRNLSSPYYMAEPGSNGTFILRHSVGSRPSQSEVDVPLIYADYYFIEGLLRFRKLTQ